MKKGDSHEKTGDGTHRDCCFDNRSDDMFHHGNADIAKGNSLDRKYVPDHLTKKLWK